MLRKSFVTLVLALTPAYSWAAAFVFDANVFYFSDSFTYADQPNTYQRLMWDVMPGFTVAYKGRFIIGWNYASYTLSENPGTETSLTISDMGPKFVYYMNRDKTWVVAFTYNLITTGTYTSGGTPTELRGTSMKGELGYTPMMWERVYMGAKLNYYQAAFKEEITGETALEQVANSRALIYPSFAMTIRWD